MQLSNISLSLCVFADLFRLVFFFYFQICSDSHRGRHPSRAEAPLRPAVRRGQDGQGEVEGRPPSSSRPDGRRQEEDRGCAEEEEGGGPEERRQDEGRDEEGEERREQVDDEYLRLISKIK